MQEYVVFALRLFMCMFALGSCESKFRLIMDSLSRSKHCITTSPGAFSGNPTWPFSGPGTAC